MNFGALAGGLAQGYQTGRQIKTNQKYADAYQKNADMEADKYKWAKEAKDKAEALTDEGIDSALNAVDMENPLQATPSMAPVAVPQQAPGAAFNNQLGNLPYMRGNAAGFSQGGLVNKPRMGYAQGGMVLPNEVMAGQPEAAYQVGGLASVPQQTQQPVQQAQPQQQEKLTPRQRLSKAMLTTDLLSNPDKLNKMQAVFDAYGMGDTFKPYLERAYTAKKSGMIDGAMQLMNGQVDDAMNSLSKGGMKLADRPVKLNDDPNDHRWKINIEGTGEKTMDIGDMLSRTIDFNKHQDHQLKQQQVANDTTKTANDTRQTDADVANKNAQTEYTRTAKTQLAQAQIDRQGRMGGLAGMRPDRPEAIDKALKRRDNAIDDLSSVKNEDDGKSYVDPQKRLKYSALAVGSEQAVQDGLGRDLTAREHQALTSMLNMADSVGSKDQWDAMLAHRFGYAQQAPQQAQPPAASSASQPPPVAAAAAAAPQAPVVNPGGLAQQQQLRSQMAGIQQALQAPNLTPEQKRDLALQANEIQNQAALYRGR